MTSREAFEAFITAPPFERSVSRFDDRGAWPGSYINYEADLAWKAWQAAIAHERERCAKVCEAVAKRQSYGHAKAAAGDCADFIRSGELCAGGYWCVVCGRHLPADDDGVIVHDDVPHPETMTFDEEEKPQ